MLAALMVQGSTLPSCGEEVRPCEVALPPASELRALIGRRPKAWRVRDGNLTVVARRSEPVDLCCAIQARLRPVGTDLQAIAIRVPDLRTAIFDIRIIAGTEWSDDHDVFRGSHAEPAPTKLPFDWSLASFHIFRSRHLGEERTVTVYSPPGVKPGARLPVIYMADGLSGELAGVAEALWRSGAAAPVLLVGIASSRNRGEIGCAPRCDGRSREYLIGIPDLPPEQSRFDAHARFVTEEVMPLIEANFPVSRRREDRATAGFSSGAAWALTMAVRHPDLFGRSIAMSLGWRPAAEAASNLCQGRLFVGGGRLEDRFYERSVQAAENASRAGAEVRLLTPNAGHSFENWEILFADALRWHFPAER